MANKHMIMSKTDYEFKNRQDKDVEEIQQLAN